MCPPLEPTSINSATPDLSIRPWLASVLWWTSHEAPERRLGAFGSGFSPCGEVGAGAAGSVDGLESDFLHLLPSRFYGVLETLVLLAVADVESHPHADSEHDHPWGQRTNESSSLLVHPNFRRQSMGVQTVCEVTCASMGRGEK